MGRDLKDEINQPDVAQSTPEQTNEGSSISIQIPTDENLERTLVQIVMDDWDSSKRARDQKDLGVDSKGGKIDFEKWLKNIRDLYNARREAKTIPWKFCSNRSLRIAASILDMLHARLFATVVNEDLLRFRPGDVLDVPKVDRVSKFMFWWVWVNCRLRSFFDNWVKIVIGYGDAITQSSWKVVPIDRGTTNEEPILDESGNPILNPDGTPSVLKSRNIDLKESSTSKCYLRDKFFLQEGSVDIMREPVILEDEFPYRELEEREAKGQFKNVTNFLREKIPFSKELIQGLDTNQAERIRDVKIRNYPVKVLTEYVNFDADGDGFAEDIRIYISPEYHLYLGGVSVKDLTYSGLRPLDYTKFESRFDNPDENWGIGVVEKVKELAEEIDAIFNQMTDANTMMVLRPGFYDPFGDLDAPSLNLQPNRITPLSQPSQSIYFPEIDSPVEKLILAIRLVLEFVERLTAASSYVLGKESEIVGGSGTATRTNAIVQAAEQRFAIPSERLREGAARIIKNHLDLVQLNIPPGLESRVLSENGDPIFQPNELSQEGISGEFDCYLLSDPSQGSQENQRQITSMLYSLMIGAQPNPIILTDPTKLYKMTANIFKAWGQDPKEILGPEPDLDMIDDPADENTLMIQGDFSRVKANFAENHLQHIMKHMELAQSPTLAEVASKAPNLVNQIIQFNQQHIQEHIQMLQVLMKMNGGGASGQSTSTGNEGNDGKKPSGNSEPSGMELLGSPLGEALSSKREGEAGGYHPGEVP